jgi:hypothetical protein
MNHLGHRLMGNSVGQGHFVPAQFDGVMADGLGYTRMRPTRRLGDGIVDSVGSFISSQAAQGATSAVEPYIMGALALGAGALLVALMALSDAKKAMKSKGLSGARRGRR